MTIRSILSAAAAVGLLAAPMAAQAGTAAGASMPVASAVSVGERASTRVAKKQGLNGTETVVVGLGVVAAGVGVALALDDGKSNGS